jgi:hypothetical protein
VTEVASQCSPGAEARRYSDSAERTVVLTGHLSNPFERTKSLLRRLIELHPVLLSQAVKTPRRPRPAPPTAAPVLEAVTLVLERASVPMRPIEIHAAAQQLFRRPLLRSSSGASSPPTPSAETSASSASDAVSTTCVARALSPHVRDADAKRAPERSLRIRVEVSGQTGAAAASKWISHASLDTSSRWWSRGRPRLTRADAGGVTVRSCGSRRATARTSRSGRLWGRRRGRLRHPSIR